MNTQTKESQASLSPADALNMLKEGNQRFLNKKMINRNLNAQVEATGGGQYPFACVLGCIDSRVPSELVLIKVLEISLMLELLESLFIQISWAVWNLHVKWLGQKLFLS